MWISRCACCDYWDSLVVGCFWPGCVAVDCCVQKCYPVSDFWSSDLCFEQVWKNCEYVIRSLVTLCDWRGVKIQERTMLNYPLTWNNEGQEKISIVLDQGLWALVHPTCWRLYWRETNPQHLQTNKQTINTKNETIAKQKQHISTIPIMREGERDLVFYAQSTIIRLYQGEETLTLTYLIE